VISALGISCRSSVDLMLRRSFARPAIRASCSMFLGQMTATRTFLPFVASAVCALPYDGYARVADDPPPAWTTAALWRERTQVLHLHFCEPKQITHFVGLRGARIQLIRQIALGPEPRFSRLRSVLVRRSGPIHRHIVKFWHIDPETCIG
jgi:hypothetical protein